MRPIARAGRVDGAADALPATSAEQLRWVRPLLASFAGASGFFALAIGLGAEWPMIPAVVVGPIATIGTYLFLMVSSDANDERESPRTH